MPQREQPEPVCPECGAAFFTDHPAGRLEAVHAAPCPLLNAEDATRFADYERAARSGRRSFRRPTTAAEAQLLDALGEPSTGTTLVRYITPTVRRRSWPTLTTEKGTTT